MHVPRLPAPLLAALALTCVPSDAAHADELDALLQKGPMVRVDTDERGRFDAVFAIVDVDAPAERLWSVLVDFGSYRFFMPRVEDAAAHREADGRVLVEWRLDTPIVATRYTNEMTIDAPTKTMRARTIAGDMTGSTYEWRIVRLSDARCRMYHTARPRQMAAIVDSLDDAQQTLTVGVAVSSVMATTRAWKARAESLEREARRALRLSRPPPTGIGATQEAP